MNMSAILGGEDGTMCTCDVGVLHGEMSLLLSAVLRVVRCSSTCVT